jgi:hypothetical protein
MEINVIWVALASLVGGLIAGVLGFLKAGGTFQWSSFAQTIWTSIGAAVIFAAAYQFTSGYLTVYDILAAFLAGMGSDNFINRLVGTVKTLKAKPAGV